MPLDCTQHEKGQRLSSLHLANQRVEALRQAFSTPEAAKTSLVQSQFPTNLKETALLLMQDGSAWKQCNPEEKQFISSRVTDLVTVLEAVRAALDNVLQEVILGSFAQRVSFFGTRDLAQ